MKPFTASTQALLLYQGCARLFQNGGVDVGFERQLDILETGTGTIG